MIDEAIKSIRNLFLSSLVILLLWGTWWPSLEESLGEAQSRYQKARLDLHAWLALRKSIDKELVDRPPKDLSLDAPISERCLRRFDRGGGDWEECEDLTVEATWPSQKKHRIHLEPKQLYPDKNAGPEAGNAGRVYEIVMHPGDEVSQPLPFTDYDVFVVNTQPLVTVIPRDTPGLPERMHRDLRELERAAIGRDHPHHWELVRPKLSQHGFDGSPRQLTVDHAAVKALRQEDNPRDTSVEVYGARLGIGLFFASPGLFLGAIGFALLGPLLTLSRTPRHYTSLPWIFVAHTTHDSRVFEGILLALTGLWSVAPIVILIAQFFSDVELHLSETLAMLAGGVGLLLATVIFTLTSVQLHQVRRRSRGSEP